MNFHAGEYGRERVAAPYVVWPSYELAGLASVVGRPFSFELLEKATDWDEASVSQALDELWLRRIIESRGASEYDFTHDRLREVACASGIGQQVLLHELR